MIFPIFLWFAIAPPEYANLVGLQVGKSSYGMLPQVLGSKGNVMPGGVHSSSLRSFQLVLPKKGRLLVDGTDYDQQGFNIIDWVDIFGWHGELGKNWGNQNRPFSEIDRLKSGMTPTQVRLVLKSIRLNGVSASKKAGFSGSEKLNLMANEVRTIPVAGVFKIYRFSLTLYISAKEGLTDVRVEAESDNTIYPPGWVDKSPIFACEIDSAQKK